MNVARQSVALEAATFPCRIEGGQVSMLLGNGTTVIEAAGRTCYKSEDRITATSAGSFVAAILSHKPPHLSVIEHASATFRIVCDRGVSHELVRHRLASYSQESTRYCNYVKDRFGREITVIEPPGLTEAARMRWVGACQAAEEAYFDLLAGGAAPQIARAVLPTCLKTEIVATMNFRTWLHFLELRCAAAAAAHPQMREVAELVGQQLAILCREVFRHDARVGKAVPVS